MKSASDRIKGAVRPLLYKFERARHRAYLGRMFASDPEKVASLDPFHQIYIDPWMIRSYLPEGALVGKVAPTLTELGRFHRIRSAGLLIRDSWIETLLPYFPEKELLFDALSRRIKLKEDWASIPYYIQCLADVSNGQPTWNKCKSVDDVRYTAEKVDQLILRITENGMKTNDDPVLVNLAPNGEFVKNGNGQHRIMIGMILDIKVPVQVLVCDSKDSFNRYVAPHINSNQKSVE